MDRKSEIEIIIEYLKNEVKNIANNFDSILSETIVKTGKLIDKYQNELDDIKRSN